MFNVLVVGDHRKMYSLVRWAVGKVHQRLTFSQTDR